MTDSAFVFPPGYRLTDSDTGAPISGAAIEFYDAGTTTAKTVYADKDLTTILGTSVITDSLGRPTSDGTTPTDIFVGTANYKVVIKDGDGNTLETKDNRPGAVVSASSVDVSVTATFPVVTKSLAYSVLAADQNTTFLVNCSSADVTLTLPSATDDDIPNGWKIKVQHAGSANQAIVVVKSGSGQSINEGSKTYGGASFALALNGEDCEITADGGNWRVSSHTVPHIKMAQGVIPITDRVSTSPSSPQAGALYILTGVGGSFSTFTTGDIAMYTGAGWVNFTPYTDCGWVAYVADENLYYRYIDSAWVVESATTSVSGTVILADSPTMEAASDLSKPVTPGRQHMHPSAAKVWGKATVSAGTPTLAASYNMTSITDVAVGALGLTIATDFSSSDWGANGLSASGNLRAIRVSSQAAGTANLASEDSSASSADPAAWYWTGFGDQ